MRGAAELLGDRELRQRVVVELDRDRRALGDQQRVVTRLGQVAEEVAHLGGRLQVVLVAVEAEAVRVRDQRAGADAQQGVVHLGVVVVHVVQVVRRQQRRRQLLRDREQLRVRAHLFRYAVVLELDEEVLPAEDALQSSGQFEGLGVVVAQERLEDDAAETARGRDEPRVVALEQVPVEAGLVVVPLEERQGGQFAQVAVALVGAREQCQVVVQLLAALGLAAGVVDLAATRRSVEARVGRHVGLEADDRRHVVLATGLVEVDDAVEVAVVGDGDGALAVGLGGEHHLLDARRAVEHRVLGVVVEVDEALSHQRTIPFAT